MNVLFLSLLYPADTKEMVDAKVKDKMQNQIDAVQHAILDGIRANLQQDEQISVINCLPVGTFPNCYHDAFIHAGWHDNHSVYETGCINLPFLKQKGREKRVYRQIVAWASRRSENRIVVLYTMYLPFLKAFAAAKKRFPDLKMSVIVTDLPNQYGIPSGRVGLMQKIEYKRGEQALALCGMADGYIVMSLPMLEVLPDHGQAHLLMEGIIASPAHRENEKATVFSSVPSVLYTGTLDRSLNIPALVDSMANIPEAELWLCGAGDAEAYIAEAAAKHPNIRFFGYVSREKALELQQQAMLLINPRLPDERFTRYSFPSKTLEYLLSEKPVLCCKLDGIPDDYDAYLHYFNANEPNGMEQAIRRLLFETSKDELKTISTKGKAYVLEQKSSEAQGKRIAAFLRTL